MKKYLLPLLLCLCCLFPCLALAAEADATVPGAAIAATIIGWLPESWGQWITFVVTICAAISAVWPFLAFTGVLCYESLPIPCPPASTAAGASASSSA